MDAVEAMDRAGRLYFLLVEAIACLRLAGEGHDGSVCIPAYEDAERLRMRLEELEAEYGGQS